MAEGDTDYARRLRELRSLHGYKLATHRDRPDLRAGQYMLEELPERDPTPGANKGYSFRTGIPARLRREVLERNGMACQYCGAGVGDISDSGRPVRLHVGHIVDAADGGKVEIDNLRALCSDCNLGEKDVMPMPPTTRKIMALLRNARIDTQREVLAKLLRRFPDEAQGAKQ